MGCRIQDLGLRGYRWWKTAEFSHSARCAPCLLLPVVRTHLSVVEEPAVQWVIHGALLAVHLILAVLLFGGIFCAQTKPFFDPGRVL